MLCRRMRDNALFFSQIKIRHWYVVCSRKVSPNHEGTTMTSCSSFSGGNACQSADASALAPRVADKVAAHPCYSRSGHHRFARMHLPVAPPAICSATTATVNSTAAMSPVPGVIDAADPRAGGVESAPVARAIPQLSVVGIAGAIRWPI